MEQPIFFITQKDAFYYADQNNHQFIVAKDLNEDGEKKYASFPNITQFIEYYSTIPDKQKHLNELIRIDKPHYEFYDIDLTLPKEYDISIYNNESLFTWLDNIRNEFLQSLHLEDKIKANWFITCASGKEKLSLHLVNKNIIFTSNMTFKHYYNLLKTYVENYVNEKHPFKKCIDWCVSSRNKCMRLCHSTKINSIRTLKIYKSDDLNHISSIAKNPSLIDTFITNAINDPDLQSKVIDINDNNDTKDTKNNTQENHTKQSKLIRIDHSNDLLKNLLAILSKDRYDSYEDWLKIGFALKNHDEGLFHLWDDWSKQSSKYSSNIKNVWDKFGSSTNPITIGSIHFMAKKDNPEKYKEIISQHSYKKIEDIEFTPQETVNHKYIPSELYINNIKKYDVIALKSNMNTGKTYSMPVLFNNYRRIIVVYHRISLNLSIYEKWKQYGFELYSDISDYKINLDDNPRIICQLDSIHRIIGKCDLLILDEIESTHEHLCGSKMLNETDKCSKTLINYIKNTPKIIACDANLKDETCNILFDKKNIIKIENTYKSFHYRSCNVYHSKESLIEKLYELVDLKKNIVIPTNSKKQAKKIEKLLSKKYDYLKILRIDAENGFIPIEEWSKYNVIIYTPTITAGVSFDEKHFHSLIGFFSNKSASTEQCSQMIFRVRNLIDNNLFIYVDNDSENPRPSDDLYLNKYIQNIIFNSTKESIEGLDIDRYNKKVIETRYFKLYRFYLKKINLSQGFFNSYMTQILREHGIKIFHISPKVDDYKIFHSIVDSLKEVSIQIKQEEAQDIVNAICINDKEYRTLIESKTQKDKNETNSIKRYILTNTFDRPYDDNLDIEWVKHNIDYYNGYKYFKLFKDDNDINISIEKCKKVINI
jgi:hypothetical protein